MEGMIGMGAAGIVGLVIGFALARLLGGSKHAPESAPITEDTEWWKIRETLTGTQLQILQYLESKKTATISQLQEKFSFIPDRELYYRLEQIVLMGFAQRRRKDSEVIYALNEDYSVTVEDDKTVMLGSE